MPTEKQVSIRLPESALARAEALVDVLAALPEHQAFRIERAVVLRIAVLRGLAELEREHGTATATPKRRVKSAEAEARAFYLSQQRRAAREAKSRE
jgi:hypothetical protein